MTVTENVLVGCHSRHNPGFLRAMFHLPSAAEKISKAAPWAIYGIVLILCAFILPGGVAGLIRTVQDRLKK